LREDKADVVAFLKRALQQRTDQISELQARLEGLQHVHETDGQAYEKKIADMKQDLERTKEQLGSENMVLTKKLDALEEFRIQREQLMAKFDEQETKVEEQKKFYEAKIYEQVKHMYYTGRPVNICHDGHHF
jgi:septal ring factor EnvC (AmiA/AmiB activator)